MKEILLDASTKGFYSVAIRLIRVLPNFLLKIINVYGRPSKLSVSISNKSFSFARKYKEINYEFLCLNIRNSSDDSIWIEPAEVYINKENYLDCLGRNPYYSCCVSSEESPTHISPSDDAMIFNFYKSNWLAVTQKISEKIQIKPHSELVLPLYIYKFPRLISETYEDSRLFSSKKKLSVRLIINSKAFEYGIDSLECYKRALNNLAYYEHTGIEEALI